MGEKCLLQPPLSDHDLGRSEPSPDRGAAVDLTEPSIDRWRAAECIAGVAPEPAEGGPTPLIAQKSRDIACSRRSPDSGNSMPALFARYTRIAPVSKTVLGQPTRSWSAIAGIFPGETAIRVCPFKRLATWFVGRPSPDDCIGEFVAHDSTALESLAVGQRPGLSIVLGEVGPIKKAAVAAETVVKLSSTNGAEHGAPRNVEAEQSLLGEILINNEANCRVADFLKADQFFERCIV